VDRDRGYLVPLLLGLEDEPLGVDDESLDDELLDPLGVVVVAGGVDGVVVVGGDADGVRSPGRSPTRSVRDSLQAVSSPAPSARAQRPVSTLFIAMPPCGGCGTAREAATGMPPSAP
jgi:hypothetical protein